jgi:RNA polymerase sigma-70 factor (ECF subfamily)
MSETLFEKLIVPASDKMYRYALSILREPDTAQDVVQECLMKIWDNRQKLPEIQSPEAWAMRITRNQCFDWVKTNRFTMYSDTDHDQADRHEADQELLVSDHLHWLEKILQALPEKQREVFHLREVEELTYQDIADVLSLSVSDVKVNLHRARTKVKEFITKTNAYGIAN